MALKARRGGVQTEQSRSANSCFFASSESRHAHVYAEYTVKNLSATFLPSTFTRVHSELLAIFDDCDMPIEMFKIDSSASLSRK